MRINRSLIGLLFVSPFLCGQQSNLSEYSKDTISNKKLIQLEEVVISDSRFPLVKSKSGKSIIKINKTEIEQFQGEELSTLIRNFSGIDILGSRTYPGQNKTFSIRGGRNRQVLVLIDGVRVSDPARIDNDFDLTFLNLENIETIEIQKGASSTLYGSAAATGIINIITKKSSLTPQLEFQSSLGTAGSQDKENVALSTFRNTVAFSNTYGKLGFKINGSHFYTDGMSAVIGDENDPFMRYSIGTQVNNDTKSKLRWTLGYDKEFIRSDYDNTFPIEDAPFSLTKALDRFRFTPSIDYRNGGVTALFGYQKTVRDFKSSFPFATKSENINLDVFNKLVIAKKIYTILGIQFQSNYANYEGLKKTYQRDLYLNTVYNFSDAFRINSGIRFNNHSSYGNQTTYSINPSYTFQLKNEALFKLLSSLSTAFIAPSIYQLYDPFSGNEALKPEENQSFELGFNVDSKAFDTTVMFFNRVESPSLIYDLGTFRYANALSEALYRGLEIDLSFRTNSKVGFNVYYTFTETEDGDLRYLPKHAFNGSLNYTINKRSSVLVNAQYIGDRYALDNTTVLKGYTLMDIRFRHQFKNSNWSAFIAATNIFNKDYIEIEGFATRGRNIMSGFSFKMN